MWQKPEISKLVAELADGGQSNALLNRAARKLTTLGRVLDQIAIELEATGSWSGDDALFNDLMDPARGMTAPNTPVQIQSGRTKTLMEDLRSVEGDLADRAANGIEAFISLVNRTHQGMQVSGWQASDELTQSLKVACSDSGSEDARYLIGFGWAHIFDERGREDYVDFVFDRDLGEIRALELQGRQGTAEERADMQAEIKDNDGLEVALLDGELEVSDALPDWAEQPVVDAEAHPTNRR